MTARASHTLDDLRAALNRLDGRGYRAYRDLTGRYRGSDFSLSLDRAQPDPFAPPSRVSLHAAMDGLGWPAELWSGPGQRRALADFINRALARNLADDRDLEIYRPGCQILDRTSVFIAQGRLVVRFRAALPGRGRRIDGRRATQILCRRLPEVVETCLKWRTAHRTAAVSHVHAVEDQLSLRGQLADLGLIAFVADGSLLPRRSGVDDRPLAGGLPFESPTSLRVTLDTPHSGPVSGLGLAQGVNLIVGGGYHGKSTLLRALETGIYDHPPGDGRERVVARSDAVKVRAEDGRAVSGLDISAFINRLPGGVDTTTFETPNASGSTSQAAAIIEALEAGSRLLLIDEDTSATNFMIRDARMQALIARNDEPITPFIDRVRELYDRLGVSTVLVMGGCGDYFETADMVLAMADWRPDEVTGAAREVARRLPTGRKREAPGQMSFPLPRRFAPDCLDAARGRNPAAIRASDRNRLLYGRREVDISALDQVVETGQTRAAGWIIHRFGLEAAAGMDIRQGLEVIFGLIEDQGLDRLPGRPEDDLALPRPAEVLMCLARMRNIRTATGRR